MQDGWDDPGPLTPEWLPGGLWLLPGLAGLGWGTLAVAQGHPWAVWCISALVVLVLLRWMPGPLGQSPGAFCRTVDCAQALLVGLVTVAALDALPPDFHHWPILGLFVCGTLCGYALIPALCSVLPVLVDQGCDVMRLGNASTFVLLLTLACWWVALLMRHRRTRVALQGSTRRLQAAARGTAELLRLFGHDLQQPLMALRWYAAALQRQTLSGDGQRALQALDACADAAQVMVQDLLRLERLKAQVGAEPAGHTDPASFGVLVERILLEVRPLAESRGVRLVCRGGGWSVPAQPLLLEHALRNIVGNAVTATQAGGVVVALQQRQGGWRLRVVDSGPGMPHCVLPATPGTAPDPGGSRSGLGWALIRQTCWAMGAEVQIVSRPGRGTCVTLHFPTAAPTPAIAAPGWFPRSSARSGHLEW